MNLPPPPQDDDPIITQFKPITDQWKLTDEDINRIDPKTGHTILHNYCQHINTTPREVYRYLMETKGCDVNAQDKYNDTPVHDALRYFNPNGDITVLMYLLTQMNVNANIKGQYGYTILHYACEKINHLPLDVFKLLIETQGFDINVQNNNNSTPLHYALRDFDPTHGGNITVLTYLLSQKSINGNIKGWNGNTLLHTACININYLPLDVFKLLIETNGCDVNAQDDSNDTPIHNALSCFNPRNGGDTKALTYLLSQRGVNGNIKYKYAYTLLHDACEKINRLPLEIFKLLIETMGCDVNAQDNYKYTPLHYAIDFFDANAGGDITVLPYLLSQKDINGNIKGEDGDSLLHIACRRINYLPLDVFKLLIETNGCDVNVQNNDKDTPLHQALAYFKPHNNNDITVLTYLINQNNANINIKDQKGFNSLHLACICNISESTPSVELNAECDTIMCRIVEFIAERCVQEVLDETNLE
jgi:ankyrin repeat protein